MTFARVKEMEEQREENYFPVIFSHAQHYISEKKDISVPMFGNNVRILNGLT